MHPAIKFYFKAGKWRVTSVGNRAPAREWWNAINHVKCLNHKLRLDAQRRA